MCRLLVDLDEWGQLTWLNLLLRYARTMLPKQCSDGAAGVQTDDVDLELLLSSSESLLLSRNPAVSYDNLCGGVGDLTAAGNPCNHSYHFLLEFRLKNYSSDSRTLAITSQLSRG